MREHHAVRGVAAYEEGRHQEPELGHPHRFQCRYALRLLERRRRSCRARSAGGAVRAKPALGRVVANEEERNREHEHEEPHGEPEVARAPTVRQRERHRQRDYHELPGRHSAGRQADRDAAALLEPAGCHRRSGGDRESAGAHRHQEPYREVDLREALRAAGAEGAQAKQKEREDDDPPRAPAVGEPADEGPDRAQEKERDRGDARQGSAAPAELGFHGFDVNAERGAEPGAGHHAKGHGGQHNPRGMRPPDRAHGLRSPRHAPGIQRRSQNWAARARSRRDFRGPGRSARSPQLLPAGAVRLKTIASRSASAVSASPSANSRCRSFSESGSWTSRWIVRLSGRAPNVGS